METGWKGRRMPSNHRYVPIITTTTAAGFDVAVVAMMMLLMTSVVVCVVVDSSSIASKQDGDRLRSDIYRQEDDDSSHCQTENESCLSNQNCCHGYICSRDADPETGLSAEAGVCRDRGDASENLPSCHLDDQCAHGSQCIDSDGTGQGFCRTRAAAAAAAAAETEQEEAEKGRRLEHMYHHERKGGLGSGCESTSDCKELTMDGVDRLCCQDVRRGRQGTKRMCDRVTGISICIQ